MAFSIYERCFVYSPTQKDDLIKSRQINSTNKIKLGTVIVNGVPKDYTDMITDMSKSRYSDAILVAKGDIRRMKFTEPVF